MRLGLDFDNTLIDYDRLIRSVAIERGVLPASSPLCGKRAIRDAIRRLPEGDLHWQRIQSHVYATAIAGAAPAAGLEHLFDFVRSQGVETWIVSHKTRTAPFDPAQSDLRAAALGWMEAQGFFDPEKFGLRRDHVIFADTLDQKVAAIARLECSVFVDDLPEVLQHRGFPEKTRRLLYAPEPAPAGELAVATSWAQAVEFLTAQLSHERLAQALRPIVYCNYSFTPVTGGRNSRCFRVALETEPGRPLFLKQYYRSATDRRDRLGTEYGAISFMQAHGIDCVPTPLFCDRETCSAGYRFVEGTRALDTGVTAGDIDALLAFLRRLHEKREAPRARALPRASEACFSLGELEWNLTGRFERLARVPHAELQDFLFTVRGVLHESVAEARDALAFTAASAETELELTARTLSPSDIGFHNALRTPDGRLVFIDFEYFGWDDPAKLICDFLLQPEQRLTESQGERFRDAALALYAEPGLPQRLEAYLPLFRLKWVAILLNEFLRDDGARRAHATRTGPTAETAAGLQLAKARRMLEPLLQRAPRT